MITILEWLAETLGLGALKAWLADRKSTAEELGIAEEKARIEDAKIVAMNKGIQNAKDAHTEVMAESNTKLDTDLSQYVRDPGK